MVVLRFVGFFVSVGETLELGYEDGSLMLIV